MESYDEKRFWMDAYFHACKNGHHSGSAAKEANKALDELRKSFPPAPAERA